jgi:hypothetical protein
VLPFTLEDGSVEVRNVFRFAIGRMIETTAAGGPRRDGRAWVADKSGRAIPGLYAAGGAGSVWRHLIRHGGGLTDAIAFGGPPHSRGLESPAYRRPSVARREVAERLAGTTSQTFPDAPMIGRGATKCRFLRPRWVPRSRSII